MGVEPPNLPFGYASAHCCKPQPSHMRTGQWDHNVAEHWAYWKLGLQICKTAGGRNGG